MRLFKYEGYKITIEPEALLLKPFKAIWQRDKSKSKDNAMMELGFVYFFCDPRSDYQYITDEERRMEMIKEGEGMKQTWKPDKLVQEAITFYDSFKTTSALLLEDTRVAVDKLRQALKDLDINEKDKNEKPIYTLNTITSTIKQVPGLVKDLDEAERAIAVEIVQSDKVRGAQEKSMYEDM